MAWTEDRIATLTKLWAEGLTASQIAQELGDVTRNAVIGKAHRLGLSGRPSPVRAQRSTGSTASRPAKPKTSAQPAAARTVAKPAAPKVQKAPTPPAVSERPRLQLAEIEAGPGVTLLKVTDKMCKWPIGHPGDPDFRLCGRPAGESGPYCEPHGELAYQTIPPKRDRRAGAA